MSSKGGVCRGHGSAECDMPFCTNKSKHNGLCGRHGAYPKLNDVTPFNIKAPPGHGLICPVTQETATTGTKPADVKLDLRKAKRASLPADKPDSKRPTAIEMVSEAGLPVEETLLSLQQMHGKNKTSTQTPRDSEEIEMYTILQIPYYITYNFCKVGFVSSIVIFCQFYFSARLTPQFLYGMNGRLDLNIIYGKKPPWFI
mmetsp:Transcript_15143/g.21589  ORF Transcript_15143/g.21589 Transcript_15143/m.21589 type:complete len:200 (+) Transcript_15143:364-963(+)